MFFYLFYSILDKVPLCLLWRRVESSQRRSVLAGTGPLGSGWSVAWVSAGSCFPFRLPEVHDTLGVAVWVEHSDLICLMGSCNSLCVGSHEQEIEQDFITQSAQPVLTVLTSFMRRPGNAERMINHADSASSESV